MKLLPRIWATFVIAKLLPVSNESEIIVNRTLLIHCNMTNKFVGVGRLIAYNIYQVAQDPKKKLGYHQLITHLIIRNADVDVPIIERIISEKPITAGYI